MNIEFSLAHDELIYAAEPPSPAINELPEWYKKTYPYIGKKKISKNGFVNATIKKCVPVLDAMSFGYIIKTWTDLLVDNENGIKSFTMPNHDQPNIPRIVDGHPIEQLPLYPVPEEYEREFLKWINPWHIKTPRGYSCLFTTPFSHELPFKLIDGVVDTDTFPLTINFPFILKNDFEGIIPKGTPMVQVIPFKRDSFKSKITSIDKNEYQAKKFFHDTKFYNKYKNLWWNRKVFQ